MSNKDELAGILAGELNKQFKSHQVAYFLDGAQQTPTDITDWVSTGSTLLDLAISNRPDGGLAAGRITEINGLEGTGKSLIGAHALASTQKKGGLAVYDRCWVCRAEWQAGHHGQGHVVHRRFPGRVECHAPRPHDDI